MIKFTVFDFIHYVGSHTLTNEINIATGFKIVDADNN